MLVQDCVFTGGHGASIGSLGEGGSLGTVTDVVMKRLRFVDTDYAARVKTWQVSSRSFASFPVGASDEWRRLLRLRHWEL